MNDNYIDLSRQLLEERRSYIKYRAEGARCVLLSRPFQPSRKLVVDCAR